jgi:hypothetical protein
VFESKVVRKVFRTKRDEVSGDRRRVHKVEFHDLYCSPDVIPVVTEKKKKMAGHVSHIGENRGAYRVLVGKPEGKRALGRPPHRWEDNIKMDFQAVGWENGLD